MWHFHTLWNASLHKMLFILDSLGLNGLKWNTNITGLWSEENKVLYSGNSSSITCRGLCKDMKSIMSSIRGKVNQHNICVIQHYWDQCWNFRNLSIFGNYSVNTQCTFTEHIIIKIKQWQQIKLHTKFWKHGQHITKCI